MKHKWNWLAELVTNLFRKKAAETNAQPEPAKIDNSVKDVRISETTAPGGRKTYFIEQLRGGKWVRGTRTQFAAFKGYDGSCSSFATLEEAVSKLCWYDNTQYDTRVVPKEEYTRGAQPGVKPYTVLVLRPDYVANTFGQDTYCAYTEGETIYDAVRAAQIEACEADEQDTPEDYPCLFCTDGHVRSYQDGAGGVSEPLPRKPRGGRGENAPK